jgi:hypothetical protein
MLSTPEPACVSDSHLYSNMNQPMPMSISPDLISLAICATAARPEEHWRLTVLIDVLIIDQHPDFRFHRQPHVYGMPA